MLHDLLENMAQWHSLDTSYNYQSFPPRPSDPFLNTFQRLYQTPYLISNWLSLITCFKESSLAKDLYWLQKFLLGCWNSAMREYSNVNNLSSVQLWMNGQKKKKKSPTSWRTPSISTSYCWTALDKSCNPFKMYSSLPYGTKQKLFRTWALVCRQ